MLQGFSKNGAKHAGITWLALALTDLLACGPAVQSVQEDTDRLPQGPQEQLLFETAARPAETTEGAQQNDHTDNTECPHTQGDYPNLIEDLQEIVRKYETCELTEEQAAALDEHHHDNLVLTQVWTTPNSTIMVDEWMGTQSISPRSAIDGVPLIYAYVRVSLLVNLSQQAGIDQVMNISLPFPVPEESFTAGATGASDSSSDNPILPTWLKGYKDSKLRFGLVNTYQAYLKGTLSDDFCGRRGDHHISITVYMKPDQEVVDAVTSWLANNDSQLHEELYVGESTDYGKRLKLIGAGVRYDKLIPLSEQEGVEFLLGPECIRNLPR